MGDGEEGEMGNRVLDGYECQSCGGPKEPKPSVRGEDSFYRYTCDECIARVEAAPSVHVTTIRLGGRSV